MNLGPLNNWLQYISHAIKRRQADRFVYNANRWYQLSSGVLQVCVDALYSGSEIHRDVGSIMDEVDRMLFQLSQAATSVSGILKGRDKKLAFKLSRTVDGIFRLRNETTQFLLRSQDAEPQTSTRNVIFYFWALERGGFDARHSAGMLEKDVQAIWGALQQELTRASRTAIA